MEERRLSGGGKQKFQLTNISLYYPGRKPVSSQEWLPPTSAVQQDFSTQKKDTGLLAAKPPGLHSLFQGAIGAVVNVFLPHFDLQLNQLNILQLGASLDLHMTQPCFESKVHSCDTAREMSQQGAFQ